MPPGCDRISELPEYLLTQILSCLPTKQSVKTSVLSKRWKNLWLKVPVFDFDCSVFPYGSDEELLSFIDRFLEFDPELRLQKVKITCSSMMVDGMKDRIGTAISRGAQHLEVESSTEYVDEDTLNYPCVEFMPLNLYTSKTLVSLKLSSSGLRDPGLVSMPCLKSMTLVEAPLRLHLEKLLSGCPVLEELTLLRDLDDAYASIYDEFAVVRVRSRSLKRFRVPLRHGECCWSRVRSTLEIDAPGLEHMRLGEDNFDSIVVKNLTSLFVVDLDIKFVVNFGVFFDPGDFSKINEIRSFLTGISSVRHMIISKKTVKALDLYSKGGVIPKFNNLSRLEAVFPGELLQFLPAFLECCPNLKHLILEVYYSREPEDVLELTNVPRCFLSTLECVVIKRIHVWEEEVLKVASYFLENAAVLKELTLSATDYRLVGNSEIYEEVNKVTKRSPSCRINLVWVRMQS